MEHKFQRAYAKTKRPTIECGESLTEQSHKQECDMNHILRDYSRTGFIKHAKEHEGKYDDISVQDFQDAMFIVAEAKNMFNELPAAARGEFANDPARFLEFVQNPDNAERMRKMGILRGNDGVDMTGASTSAPTPPPAEPIPAGDAEPTPTA